MHKPSFAKLIRLALPALIFAMSLPVRAEEEPAPVRRVDRRIASDETVVTKESSVRAEQKRVAKPAAKTGLRKSTKSVKTLSKTNLKSDPAVKVRREETPSKKSADSLSLQNSAAVGTEVTTPATATGVPSLSTTGGLGATSAGRAVGRDVTSTTTTTVPTGTILPPSQTDTQMLPMITQAMQGLMTMLGGDSSTKAAADANSKETAAEEQARLISAIEKANGVNATLNDFGVITVPVPDDCTVCKSQVVTDPIYESCSGKNGYLEDLLNKSQTPGLDPANVQRSTLTCISTSLRNSGTSKFAACANARAGADPKSVRPCASEPMVRTLASALELTSDCLAEFVDPTAATDMETRRGIRRALYQLVNHESRFAINAVSSTEASGLGQFTNGAIQTYNTQSFMRATEIIKNSSNASCKKLATVDYQRMATNTCSSVAFDNGNPQLNLIYTLMHMQDARDVATQVLNRSGLQLSPAARRDILEKMSIWGHNVGVAGIGEIFTMALRSDGTKLQNGDSAGFIVSMMQTSQRWHIAKGKDKARTNEATNFLGKTMIEMEALEKEVGRCGDYQ